MSRPYLMTTDTVKTIFQGALGAMTFGAYNQFQTNKLMELNNVKMELQNKYDMEKLETKHQKELERMETTHRKEMDELNQKYKHLEELVNQKRGWF